VTTKKETPRIENTTGGTDAKGVTETTTGSSSMAKKMNVLISTASKTIMKKPEIALGLKKKISALDLVMNAPSRVMPVEAKAR
jgi:hypothetical protein